MPKASRGYLDDDQRAAAAGTPDVRLCYCLRVGQLAVCVAGYVPLGLATQEARPQHHPDSDVRAGHCLDIDQQDGLVPWQLADHVDDVDRRTRF